MPINKWIVKDNCFKNKHKEICDKTKVDDPEQIFLKNNVAHICKIMKEKEVDQIMNKLITNKRTGSKIYLKEPQNPLQSHQLLDKFPCTMLCRWT